MSALHREWINDQAERPDLWTPETIERAKTAALIAAAGRK